MAMNIGIRPLKFKHRWGVASGQYLNNIVTEAVSSLFYNETFDPTYEDYIGICHQIIAIELGYIKL